MTNDPGLRSFFGELALKVKIDQNFSLESLVTNDRDSGLRYVDRKHTKRNNEVGWGEQERHNYKIRRGNASAKTEVFRYELGKSVKKLDLPDEVKEAILGKGSVTTFYRLVDSEPAMAVLGIQKNDDGTIKIKNQKEFNEKLKVIVFDIVTKRVINGEKLDSRFLNKTKEKEEYLKSIGAADKKRVDSEIQKNTHVDIFGKKILNIKKAKGTSIYASKTTQIKTLIDPILLLPDVKSDKIKEIFAELQRVNLEFCPTACALLLRTLMEISVAEFADKKSIKIDNNGYFRTDKGKTKESLKEKIDYISSQYAPKDIQGAVAVFNGNSIFTENLNQIAHSRHVFSSKDKVKTLWKDSKCFWEFMIAKIIEIEKKKK